MVQSVPRGPHDVPEDLVPRRVTESAGHPTLHASLDHDVDAADVGEQAQHLAQVGILKLDVDATRRRDGDDTLEYIEGFQRRPGHQHRGDRPTPHAC